LREECRLRVFKKRVLRRIFGPKKGEVTGELRRLPKEELDDPVCLPNIVQVTKIKNNEMGGACSTYGGQDSCIQGFGGEA
jgi:hypothetical protein